MILTTSNSIEGYVIVEYVDVIFDEMLVGLGFFKGLASGIDNLFSALSGTEATTMIEKLNDAKSELRKRIETKAEELGANALIGIDFESSKLGDLLMVSMTATAVRIEKLFDYDPKTFENQERKKVEEKEKAIIDEKRRKEEDYQNRIKALNESGKIDFDVFFDTINSFEKTWKIKDLLISLKDKYNDIIDDSLIEEIEKNIYLENMYGGNGKEACIKLLKERFGYIK